mgnify:CR=1 FL=1
MNLSVYAEERTPFRIKQPGASKSANHMSNKRDLFDHEPLRVWLVHIKFRHHQMFLLPHVIAPRCFDLLQFGSDMTATASDIQFIRTASWVRGVVHYQATSWKTLSRQLHTVSALIS